MVSTLQRNLSLGYSDQYVKDIYVKNHSFLYHTKINTVLKRRVTVLILGQTDIQTQVANITEPFVIPCSEFIHVKDGQYTAHIAHS
jgi:hypothetical protein